MKFNSKISCLLFVLLFNRLAFSQSQYFEKLNLKENILQVADSNAIDGDWKNAILQYYEYLYRFPEDSTVPVIYYKIAAVYKRSNKLDLAQSYLQKVVDKYSNSKYDLESRMRLAFFLFEKGDYDSSLIYSVCQPEFPFKIITAYNLIALDEVSLADSILGIIVNEPGRHLTIIGELVKDLEVIPSMNWIRKWGSISLSGIIPGSGRIALEEYWDGTLTMLGFCGLCGIALVTERFYPQLYYYVGTGIFLYYFGNLFSTFDATKRYDVKLREKYLRELTRKHSLKKVLCLEDPI